MEDYSKLLTSDNKVLRCYFTCVALLVLKTMVMSFFTIKQRLKHGVPISPEDENMYVGKIIQKSHENIDRVRRAHLNDLENIPLFIFIGFPYILTNPKVVVANILCIGFTIARFVHTYVYIIDIKPQPARGYAWVIGYAITGFMAFSVIGHFLIF